MREKQGSISGSVAAGWIAALAIVVCGLAAPPAGATIFDIGKPEKVGTFKVLGGSYDQRVNYFANYRFTTSDDCWYYDYSDTGGSSFHLKFDKGEVDRWKWTGEDLPMRLTASGSAARNWSGSVRVTETPKEYRDDCGPAAPLRDNNRSCGTAKIKSEPTGFHLVGMKHGRFSITGPDTSPFGPVLKRDPFAARGGANCPSSSSFGLLAIPSIAKKGFEKLDDAKIGDTITLSGSGDERGPGPANFAVFGDWVSGSHVDANVDWHLKLKRVKTAK